MKEGKKERKRKESKLERRHYMYRSLRKVLLAKL